MLYLKYDLSEQALEGEFDIPDLTPSTIKGRLDQFSLQFDTLHDTNGSVKSDHHMILIARDKCAEYYMGNPMGPYQVKSIKNSTLHTYTMDLQHPFSRIDFNVINSSMSNWVAEFRSYF